VELTGQGGGGEKFTSSVMTVSWQREVGATAFFIDKRPAAVTYG
jgi:hypothetical protein